VNLIRAIILGIVQGLTEFLPISSSGHLVLFQHFFQQGKEQANDISLEAFLHLGSLLAVVIYFRKDLLDLLKSMFHWKRSLDSSKHYRSRMVIVYLALSTLVTGLIYVLFGDLIKATFAQPLFVALMLSVTGLILLASDTVRKSDIPASGLGIIRSIIIGLGQGISMLPGISRSGTTIAASLLCGVKRADAARFSFLLSIPAILFANLNEIPTLQNLSAYMLTCYIAGALTAFVSGYIVIEVLIRVIQASKLKYFAIYCWLVSALTIAFILLK